MGEAVKKPIYDDKVDLILKGLTEGKSREELAEELGYKNYKSLDMYMRRKNWSWNPRTQNYEAEVPKPTFEDRLNQVKTIGTKVGRVIELFNSGIEDPMEIAKKAGFRDHKEMAEHMKNKYYIWDDEKGNYIMQTGLLEDGVEKDDGYNKEVNGISNISDGEVDLNQIIPLLKALQNKLSIGIIPETHTQSIPTYLVPGNPTSITMQMMLSLRILLKEYSSEFNISQRRIVEVALIEFFNKYGYNYKVKSMLNS